MKQENIAIMRSENGRDGWVPVPPAEVPDWLKEPDVMGNLVAGNMACKNDEGDKGSAWYRAERVPTDGERQTMDRAAAKRARRAQRNRTIH